MMLATIIWLYRGSADKIWLGRLPSNWRAADAVPELLEAAASIYPRRAEFGAFGDRVARVSVQFRLRAARHRPP